MVVALVFTIKLDYGLSEASYDRIVEWERRILPERNMMKMNFHVAKSMMKPFNLGYQKADMCPNFCMLYYFKNAELILCRTCRHACYKPRTNRERTFITYKKLKCFLITHRLQRLFMSPNIANHMARHHPHDAMNGVMVHSFDGKTCKYFNIAYP